MAALLCLHGAATPGILVGMNGVVAFTGGATLPVGCGIGILSLGAMPELRRPSAVRPLVAALLVGSLGVLGLGITMIVWPSLVPSVPEPRSALALSVLGLGLGACALLAGRALRTYRLTRRVADLAVVIGIAWLAAALVGALYYSFRDVGWWLGHALEIGGQRSTRAAWPDSRSTWARSSASPRAGSAVSRRAVCCTTSESLRSTMPCCGSRPL